MATDATQIIVGAGTFSIGDYTSSGGAGSLTDVGHVKSPYEIGSSYENFDVTTERATGIVKTVPLNDSYTLKVYMHEATASNLRILLGQPSANQSGTSPDETLLVGDRAEQYHQGTIVTSGAGTTGVRTFTFWKLQISAIDPIQIGKGVEQVYAATFRVLRDDTLGTADKYFKQVDA